MASGNRPPPSPVAPAHPGHRTPETSPYLRSHGAEVGEILGRRSLAIFLGAAALVLLGGWSALYLTWPFGQDQSAFAWVADVILAGGLPYRDAWEVKGPLAYYLVALANLMFGRNYWGIRLFDLLVLAIGAFPLYRVLRHFIPASFSLAGIGLFLLWYAALNFENTAQPDGWAGLLLAGSAAALLTHGRAPGTGRALAAGAFIGACTLLKPTYAMFLALPFVYGLLREGRERGWLLRFWGAVAAGFALPILAFAAWFALHGALSWWIEVQFVWLLKVYTGLGLPWAARVNKALAVLLTGGFAPALPLAVAGLGILHRRDRAVGALMATWIALGIVSVLLQGKPWPYLWLPLYPALAILTGIGLHGAARWLREERTETAVVGTSSGVPALLTSLAVVLFGAAALPVAERIWEGKGALRGGEAAVAYDAAEFGTYGRGPESLAAVAEHVRERTRPGDRVLTWGMTPTPNFLGDRASPTRFGVKLPVIGGRDTPLRRAYRREFMRDLADTPPAYVVVHVPECAMLGWDDDLDEYPEFAAFLARRYHLEREVGCSRVLRANSGALPSRAR